jgi:hypothetical protein
MRTDGLISHRGPEQRNRKDCGGSNEFEIVHRVSPFGLKTQWTNRRSEPTFRPWFLKET